MKDFKVSELYRDSWKMVKENFWLFFVALIAVFSVSFLTSSDFFYKGMAVVGLSSMGFIELFWNVFNFFWGLSITYVVLQIVRWGKVSCVSFWEGITRERIWKLFVGALLIMAIVVVVVIPFVIFGFFASAALIANPYLGIALWGLIFVLALPTYLFFGVRFWFVSFLVIGERTAPWDAISISWKMSKGYFWKILGVQLFSGLCLLLGMLALVVGLFWAIPLVMLAQAKLYTILYQEYQTREEKLQDSSSNE